MGKHLHAPGHLAANATPNSVYRYFDHADRLIYIGVTARGIQRQQEHEKLSDWFDHADHQQIEKCPDRVSALTLERELIKAYRPPFNKVHNPGWEQIRAAYLKVVSAETALDDARARIVPQRPAVEPEACGHCSYCTQGSDDPDDGICEALNSGGCDICDDPSCIYPGARSEGSMEGYMYGWDGGEEAGKRSVLDKFTAEIVGGAYAEMVLNGVWRREAARSGPVFDWPEFAARDAALSELSAASAAGKLDELAAETAARIPF